MRGVVNIAAGRGIAWTAAAACLAVVAAAGCQPVGFLAYVIGGEGTVERVHKLDKRPTVVLVDDPSEPGLLPSPQLTNLIAGRVGDALVREGVLKEAQVVAANRVSRLAAEHMDFEDWAIDRVGLEVGAEQVVYVLVTGFTVSQGGAVYEPAATVRVKVMDAETGRRLFPARGSHPVATKLRLQPMENATATTDLIVARRLGEALARDVARLFHKWQPEPAGRMLGE